MVTTTAQIITDLKASIRTIPDSTLKDHFATKLEELCDIEADLLARIEVLEAA